MFVPAFKTLVDGNRAVRNIYAYLTHNIETSHPVAYSRCVNGHRVRANLNCDDMFPDVRSDKVLVGVVLWNDLAIALADYRRRGSAMANNRRRSNGGLSPSFPSSTWRGGGHAYDGIGSPETAAAAAASTGKLDKFEWEEASSEEGGSVVEEDGDEGGGSLWPGLAGVAKAVGQRVGWFPRMRLAEASLLQ